MNKIVRKAQHAGPGKLYHDDPLILNKQMNSYLADSDTKYMPKGDFLFKALIGPHANMIYSGKTAAKAYKYMAENVDKFDRVVLIGPSHYAPLLRLATTTADIWETPLGDINIDQDTIDAFIKFS